LLVLSCAGITSSLASLVVSAVAPSAVVVAAVFVALIIVALWWFSSSPDIPANRHKLLQAELEAA
jgi:hypothetical protein